MQCINVSQWLLYQPVNESTLQSIAAALFGRSPLYQLFCLVSQHHHQHHQWYIYKLLLLPFKIWETNVSFWNRFIIAMIKSSDKTPTLSTCEEDCKVHMVIFPTKCWILLSCPKMLWSHKFSNYILQTLPKFWMASIWVCKNKQACPSKWSGSSRRHYYHYDVKSPTIRPRHWPHQNDPGSLLWHTDNQQFGLMAKYLQNSQDVPKTTANPESFAGAK